MILTYLLAVLAGGFYQQDSSLWSIGSLSTISKMIPGCESGWLSFWLTISGAFSAMSILNCCVSSTSREVY